MRKSVLLLSLMMMLTLVGCDESVVEQTVVPTVTITEEPLEVDSNENLNYENSSLVMDAYEDFETDGSILLRYIGTDNCVEIPNYITEISETAFCGLEYITTITIAQNVETINIQAFEDCENLTDILVLDGNENFTSIDGVLYSYDMKTVLKYPEGKTSMIYTVPNGVTTIGNSAFSNNQSLYMVELPEGIITIEDYAFAGCTKIKILNMPDSLQYTGSNAFYLCINLDANMTSNEPEFVIEEGVLLRYNGYSDSVVIPDGVEVIGNFAFARNFDITSIVIPSSVVAFENYAFRECSSLTQIIIPDSVIYIGDYAFQNCDGLISIVIPASVEYIGNSVFNSCDNLTKITVSDGSVHFKDVDGVLYNYDGTTIIRYPSSKIGEEYIIPEGVQIIAEDAFAFNSYLTSVTLPDGMISIESCAFTYCRNLQWINIPDGVVEIGDSAFYVCDSLVEINIPSSVQSIGVSAFGHCELITNIVIPDGVTSIEDMTFMYCYNLETIVIPDSVTTIGEHAFQKCESLKELIIPVGLTEIGRNAFTMCISLNEITISSTVEYIGMWAFVGCSNLIINLEFEETPSGWDSEWARWEETYINGMGGKNLSDNRVFNWNV